MKPALPSVDDRLIWDIQLASLWYPAVTASDEIGLFAALAEAPGDPAELAGRLGASPRALTIVLELLASLGLVAQELGRYQLTAVARHFLVPSSPYYWGGVLRSAARRGGVNFHNDFVTAFRKPDDSADNNAGLIAWETGEMSPELARGIAAYMQSHSAAEAVGVAHNADFTGVTRLLDVGGGSGCFAIALAQTHSEMRCTVMDLGPMCTVAADYIARAGIGDRVDTVAVDMFREPWPQGYDAIFLSNVLHDWNETTGVALLRKAHDVLPVDGRIYLHEMLLAEGGPGVPTPAAFSVQMLLGTRGRQYRASELDGMLREAGFVETTVTPTYAYHSVVAARRRVV